MNTKGLHRRRLEHRAHSEDRKRDLKSEKNDSMMKIQVPSQTIKDPAIKLQILEAPNAESTSTAAYMQHTTLQAEIKTQNHFPLIPP